MAALIPGLTSVIGPGAYVDAEVLKEELSRYGITPDRLVIDPAAALISRDDRLRESAMNLDSFLGSTLSGTGAAVARRALRDPALGFVADDPDLRPYVRPSIDVLAPAIAAGERVILEGTQGHGLSILHTPRYPFATSRTTTAAGLLAEAGLSPLDVDDIVMVLRAFPIRVAGNSGPLAGETTWQQVSSQGGHDHPLIEYSTVTRRERRVAYFNIGAVLSAIRVNRPTRLVLNHLDYLDHAICRSGSLSPCACDWIAKVESGIGKRLDLLGWAPDVLEDRESIGQMTPASGSHA
jgi:adenylosuccinate synthase